MEALVNGLRKRQAEGGFTQDAFARHIGINGTTISLLYAGKVGLGTKALGALLRRYPDMQPEVTQYIISQTNKQTEGMEAAG